MTIRNWERVRKEKLCLKRGTERIGAELPPIPSQYGLSLSESLIQPASTRLGARVITTVPTLKKADNSSASRSNQASNSGPIQAGGSRARMMWAFQNLDSASKSSVLVNLTDIELRDCRELCESAIKRLNEQMLARHERQVA